MTKAKKLLVLTKINYNVNGIETLLHQPHQELFQMLRWE